MPTLLEALSTSGHRIHWFADLPWRKPDGTTETRYRATVGWTSPPGDGVAAHRHYSGRMRVPSVSWSRVDGDSIGGRTATDVGALSIIDPDGADADAIGEVWSLDGAVITLRYGTTDMALSDMGVISITAGPRVLPDESGRGYSIPLLGLEAALETELLTSKYWGMGGCVAFDGGGGQLVHVDPHEGFAASKSLMVEAAIRPDAIAPGAIHWVVGRGNLGSRDWMLAVVGSTARAIWSVTTAAGDIVSVEAGNIQGGDLVRLTGEWTGKDINLRINGDIASTAPQPAPLQSTVDRAITIGAQTFQGLNPFHGLIDDVRVWVDHQRSEDDIKTWSQRQLVVGDTYPGLALWLPMDEGIDLTAYDESGNGHRGILQSAVVDKSPPAWSSMLEGEPDQHGDYKPVAIGESYGIPGVIVDRGRLYAGGSRQVHDGACRMITGEEGGARLGRRLNLTSDRISFVPSGDRYYIVSEDPAVDLDGVKDLQYVEVVGSNNADGIYRCRWSISSRISIAAPALPAEAAGATVTLRTTGYAVEGGDISFDAASREIRSVTTDLLGLYPGSTIRVEGSTSNNGTLTVDQELSGLRRIRVVEALVQEAAGASIRITEDIERWDYDPDLERGIAHLRATPSLPVTFAVRGDAEGGYVNTPARCIERLAVKYGGWDAAAVEGTSFAAVDAELDVVAGDWFDAPISVSEAIDRIARPLLDWGPRLDTGRLEVATLTDPGLDLAQAGVVLDSTNAFAIGARLGASPIAGLELLYRRNRTELDGDDLAGWFADWVGGEGAPATEAWRSKDWSSASPGVIDTTIAERWPSASTPAAIESALQHERHAIPVAQWLYDRDKRGHLYIEGRAPLALIALALRTGAVGVDHPDIPYAPASYRLVCWALSGDGQTATYCLWRPAP